MTRALALVPAEPRTDASILRDLIIERDRAAQVLARLDALIVTIGRERWRAQGMLGTPRLDTLRKEVGL